MLKLNQKLVILWSLAFAAAVLMPCDLTGQTTQPSPVDWPTWVQQLAGVLNTGDTLQTENVIAGHCMIREFRSDQPHQPVHLLAATSTASLLGAHAYIHPPLVMAADVAADFKNTPNLPEEARKRMVPETDEEMKRANATAVQWVTQTLGAKVDDYIVVLVFWSEPTSGFGLLPAPARPADVMFVLGKAEQVGDSFQLTRILYGNPNAK